MNPSRLLKMILTMGLLFNVLVVQAVTPKAINKETDRYSITIKYPQGFKKSDVDSTIQNYIDNLQKQFMKELAQDANTPANAPGKTGLNVTYSIPYQSKNALSVRLDVSIYHRGAAHPANHVVIQNFVKGQLVSLANLFTDKSSYLLPIADYCSKELTAQKISDTEWIKKGTQANAENYDTWYFTDKGIAVVFDTYQVAAYVYGPQTVNVPLAVFSSDVKLEMSKLVWGN